MSATTTLTQQILKYHNQTKHSFTRYSRGPPTLDWSNQPNPFRLYPPCPILTLPHPHQNELSTPPYHTPFTQSIAPSPHPLTLSTISHLLYHSLALSAWKSTPYSTWSLRVNPSSGNLHPTESYVISPPVKSLSNHAFVAHYAPKYHALELRAKIPSEFFELFPENTILVGLTSIFWREAWKYGERAFRYCNHDVGHAIGAVTMAAAGLGFDVKVLDGLGFEELKVLMGLGIFPEIAIPDRPVRGKMPEIEFEHPDCVLCIFPNDSSSNLEVDYGKIREVLLKDYEGIEWLGKPNVLSKEHVCWDVIYKTAKSTEKPVTNMGKEELTKPWKISGMVSEDAYKGFSLSEVVRKRRSAVDMDGKTSIERDTFYQILLHCMASGAGEKQNKQLALPFRALPWDCEVHAVIFVHRIVGLPKGLYFLVRNEDHFEEIRAEMRSEFKWTKPEGCPDDLPLYELVKRDCQEPSKQLSCFQDIASDGCFSLGMVARLEPALHDVGPWMYPRLFWETGVLGQVLYLEAHAIGISATGIGCFFDDPVHEILGLKGMKYQSLYHFTVGGPVEDKRIMSLPAYPGPDDDDDFNLRNNNRNVVTSF